MLCTKLILAVLLCCLFQVSEGILCLECENQPSHESCLKHGKITRCMSNQDSCQTVVRLYRFWPNGRLITKRCKQTRACITNYLQNSHACKPYRENAVCYCCCHYTRCNMDSTDKCWKEYSRAVPPEKVRDRCKSLRTVVKNKRIQCTDDYNLGSVCRFLSSSKDRPTEIRTRCIKNNRGHLSWKKVPADKIVENPPRVQTNLPGNLKDRQIRPSAQIREPQCKATDVAENQTVSCSNGNAIGSRCTYRCDEGFILGGFLTEGVDYLTCISPTGSAVPEWDGLPPLCLPEEKPVKRCEDLIYDEDIFLDVTCTNETVVGSECTFRCEIGFMVTPFESTTIKCTEVAVNSTTRWTSPVPACKRLSCDRFVVQHGNVSCKNEYFYGSSCNITCSPGYKLMPIDSNSTVCQPNLMWTREPPVCERIRCSNFLVARGVVRCTDGYNLNSTCYVFCNGEPNYYVTPSNFTSTMCRSDGAWSRDPPCCERSCSSKTPLDMVIVMDSSTSIGRSYWKNMRKFVLNLIDYVKVGPNSTNFAVFQYSTNVNSVTEIMLNQYKNKTALMNRVKEMSYQGEGTWTGIALSHAANVSLHPSNGNRMHVPDIVVVITDGQVNEEDDPLSPAKMLLQKGAKVFAIGIRSQRYGRHPYSMQQLIEISGNHKKRVFKIEKEFISPMSIYQAVGELVCQKYCD